jgi:transcriptional regulator with XRE-family HTH domain
MREAWRFSSSSTAPGVNQVVRVTRWRRLSLRAGRHISRRDLAEALGVDYQTIGYFERGEYSIVKVGDPVPSTVLPLRPHYVGVLPGTELKGERFVQLTERTHFSELHRSESNERLTPVA